MQFSTDNLEMNQELNRENKCCDDFVINIYDEYSIDRIAELLLAKVMILPDKSIQYAGSFERFVFMMGESSEVYSKPEIEFIAETREIILFREFYKKSNQGTIPCRVFATRNEKFSNPLYFSIALIKILNKASDCFNICMTVSEEGIIFTCRSFDTQSPSTYYISDIIQTEQQLSSLAEEFMYSHDYNDFAKYYIYIRDSIHFELDIDDKKVKQKEVRRIPYGYINALYDIEEATHIDFSRRIEKCFYEEDRKQRMRYADWVSETDEYMFKIETARINVMEMLFAAEEIEKMSIEAEQINNIEAISDNGEQAFEIDEKTLKMLDDPVAMIKLLKKERGI